jgi:hypothetical protein
VSDIASQLSNCRDYSLGWGQEGRQDEELTYYRSGVPHPQLNGVLRLRRREQAGLAVECATERLDGVPWLRGAVKVGEMPVIAVRLDGLTELDGPAGLNIETVDTRAALTDWLYAYSRPSALPRTFGTTRYGSRPDGRTPPASSG